VTRLDREAETGTCEHRSVSFGIVSPKTGFTDARALVDAVAREFSIELDWRAASEPPFLEGRCAQLCVGKQQVGVVGEIDPTVLETFGLENPAVMGELSVDLLARRTPRKQFVLES